MDNGEALSVCPCVLHLLSQRSMFGSFGNITDITIFTWTDGYLQLKLLPVCNYIIYDGWQCTRCPTGIASKNLIVTPSLLVDISWLYHFRKAPLTSILNIADMVSQPNQVNLEASTQFTKARKSFWCSCTQWTKPSWTLLGYNLRNRKRAWSQITSKIR